MNMKKRSVCDYQCKKVKNPTLEELKTQIEAIKKDAFGIHKLDISLTCVKIQVEGMKILLIPIPIWKHIIYKL